MTLKTILFILLFFLLIVYVGIQYFRTQHFIKIGVGLASRAVAYEQHPQNPSLRFLTIGDSSVVGTGATPESSVAGRLGQDFPQAEVLNLGVNGTRTPELAERFKRVEGQTFDLILIHTGGNDIVHFTPLEELDASLREVLDVAKPLSPNVMVLHGGNVGSSRLFPWPTRWIFAKRTRLVRELFMRVTAEKEVTYVDLWRKKKADPFFLNPQKYYSEDFFHPSGEGYGDWYEHIKKRLPGEFGS